MITCKNVQVVERPRTGVPYFLESILPMEGTYDSRNFILGTLVGKGPPEGRTLCPSIRARHHGVSSIILIKHALYDLFQVLSRSNFVAFSSQ